MKPMRTFFTAMLLSLTLSSAPGTLISFSGSSSLSGPPGNTRVFGPVDGVTVTASAESLIGFVDPWTPSYLGAYSGGLGVTNSTEGSGGNGTHTVDNVSSNDRVVFSFNASVVLDTVFLTAFGDTDISVYYWNGVSWSSPETNTGPSSDREANVNATSVAATRWAVGAIFPSNSGADSFKIKKITFTAQKVPDAGATLLLLALSLGGLFVMSLVFSPGRSATT